MEILCETAEEEFQWLSRCSGQAGEEGEANTELRPCVVQSCHTPLRTSICPITHEIMHEPVICADGHSYERKAIAEWLSQNKTSPLTGAKLPHMELVPNHALRNLIEEFSMQQQCSLGSSNWDIKPNLISINRSVMLGQGRWSTVFEGTLTQDKREVPVAIKSLPEAVPERERKLLARELQILARATMRCSRVARLMGVSTINGSLHLVMRKYVGSLGSQLLVAPNNRFSPKRSTDVILQICAAVAELHQEQIIVHDLKPSNILYDRFGQYVVSDFGASAILEENLARFTPSSSHLMAGTYNYMPPEGFDPELFGDGVSKKVDVWSVGCILLELLTGQVPWDGARAASVMRKVCDKEQHPDVPLSVPSELGQIVRTCFHYQPVLRPTIIELAEMLDPNQGAIIRAKSMDRLDSMDQDSVDRLEEIKIYAPGSPFGPRALTDDCDTAVLPTPETDVGIKRSDSSRCCMSLYSVQLGCVMDRN